jgi:hypothetical protein
VSVDFARNAVAEVIREHSQDQPSDNSPTSGNSCLHQDLTTANPLAGANQNKRRARAMSGM